MTLWKLAKLVSRVKHQIAPSHAKSEIGQMATIFRLWIIKTLLYFQSQISIPIDSKMQIVRFNDENIGKIIF